MTIEIILTTPDCEIVSTRIINSSRELIYSAWSDPDHLKNWWGPAGFTNTFNEFDFRVGGKWRFIMHGADKGNYANECEFIKLKKFVVDKNEENFDRLEIELAKMRF